MPNRTNRSITPREAFCDSKAAVEAHRKAISSEAVQEAIRGSLLELLQDLPREAPDATRAMHHYSRLVGARDFVSKFMNFSEPRREPGQQPDIGQLDHGA